MKAINKVAIITGAFFLVISIGTFFVTYFISPEESYGISQNSLLIEIPLAFIIPAFSIIGIISIAGGIKNV